MRRILVLDIDGVLNRWDFDENAFAALFVKVRDRLEPLSVMRQFLDRALVERLHLLIQHAQCEVVLSSNWRALVKHERDTFNASRHELGFEFDAVDFVPPYTNLSRGISIAGWVLEAGLRTELMNDRVRMVALDDDRSVATLGEPCHVLCDPNHGLTVGKALEVYAKLGGPDIASFRAAMQ